MNFANCNITFTKCNFSHPMPQKVDSDNEIHTQNYQNSPEYDINNPKTKRNKHHHTTTNTNLPKEDTTFSIK